MATPATGPQILFHAGFHKTGTSQLQRALDAHSRSLAPEWQTVTRATSATFVQAAEAARAYSLRMEPGPRADLIRALDDWTEALDLSPGQGLIASSEDFAGHMPGFRRLPGYVAAPDIAAEVESALLRRFPAARITFLYTIRQTESWLYSLHWQLAKHQGFVMSRSNFIELLGPRADLAALVQRIAAVLTRSDCRQARLEDEGSRRLGMVEVLYDLAHLPDALRQRLAPVTRENQRPVFDLSETFIALNRAKIPPQSLRRLKLALLASAELDRDRTDET